MLDETKILSIREYGRILDFLHARQNKRRWRLVLAVFTLSARCGMRASEIAGVNIGDCHLDDEYPFIQVRPETSKRKKGRRIRMWWDEGALNDLRAWLEYRKTLKHNEPDGPLVCCVMPRHSGVRLTRITVRRKFIDALRPITNARKRGLTCHSGRHSAATHWLKHRSLPAVRDQLGHSSVAMTSIYLHICEEDDCALGSVFERNTKKPVVAN